MIQSICDMWLEFRIKLAARKCHKPSCNYDKEWENFISLINKRSNKQIEKLEAKRGLL